MTVRSKKYGRDQDFDGNNILNSNLNIDWVSFVFADVAIDNVYFLDCKARANYTIQKIALQSDTGTITATLKINGTAITGMEEIDATSTNTDYTATALNIVEPGDVVTLEITALADTPTQLIGNLLFKRT